MYEYKAVVNEVYDGDTITATLDLGFYIKLRLRLRLLGINTPEVRGEERPEGLISRDRLREKILGKEVIVRTGKTGKYGRWISEIIFNDENINEWLVKEGLAERKEY